MRLIRAKRGLHVPVDPENPETSTMRPVFAGLVALVPDGFQMSKDAYVDLGKVKIPKEETKED